MTIWRVEAQDGAHREGHPTLAPARQSLSTFHQNGVYREGQEAEERAGCLSARDGCGALCNGELVGVGLGGLTPPEGSP